MVAINYKSVGIIGEAKTIAKFIEYGVECFKPFGDNSKIDLIVYINKHLYKLQIKTSTSMVDSAMVFNLDHHGDYSSDVDYFVLYNLLDDELYVISVDEVGTKQSITIRTKNFDSVVDPKCKLATNYMLEYKLETTFNLKKICKDDVLNIRSSTKEAKEKLSEQTKRPTKEIFIKDIE